MPWKLYSRRATYFPRRPISFAKTRRRYYLIGKRRSTYYRKNYTGYRNRSVLGVPYRTGRRFSRR